MAGCGNKDETKICPLLADKCVEIRCAWWDSIESQCAVKSIGIGAMAEVRWRER